MILFKKSTDLHKWLENQREKGKTIGFVPTMGALHAGHISLVSHSKRQDDITVCSIFINPNQFNDKNDFDKYPVTIEKDIALLLEVETDVLFLPSREEIYPPGEPVNDHYELGYLETVLEGASRPGHFQGVCQVVRRLLDMVKPNDLFLGQKDYQQCMVIRKLIELTGLKDQIKIHISPTLREPDGLAMSSRNMRLTEESRKQAPVIFRSLKFIRDNIRKGELTTLKLQALSLLENEGLRVDYVEIADADNLELMDNWDGHKKLVALVAAYLNDIRLIDNQLLDAHI